MSLPDTVFIFVLALIIFGPKKLPEIGRQLGKLVGEFRRASNEFKFQIEEELRQAELADRNTIAPPAKEPETSASSSSSSETGDSSLPDQPNPEESLPVGQYPNIDTVNPQDLNPTESVHPEAAHPASPDQVAVETVTALPTISPAVGTEARTTPPYSVAPDTLAPPADSTTAFESHATASIAPPAANSTKVPNHEPADPYIAPAVADVTHG
jgi:sec-independent protein translocase protein TatB